MADDAFESKRVLIVEDEQRIRDTLCELFDVPGIALRAAADLETARAELAAHPFDLIITDLRLGGKRDGGLQVMAAGGMLSPDATVVVLTAFPDADNRRAAHRLGATHFLEKPVDLRTIAALVGAHGIPTALGGSTSASDPGERKPQPSR